MICEAVLQMEFMIGVTFHEGRCANLHGRFQQPNPTQPPRHPQPSSLDLGLALRESHGAWLPGRAALHESRSDRHATPNLSVAGTTALGGGEQRGTEGSRRGQRTPRESARNANIRPPRKSLLCQHFSRGHRAVPASIPDRNQVLRRLLRCRREAILVVQASHV